VDSIAGRRQAAGLTRREAAYRAGITLERWRRLESGSPAKLGPVTARAVSRVLDRPETLADDVVPQAATADQVADFNVVFVNDPRITPRQAWRLSRMANQFDDVPKYVLPYLPRWTRFVVNEQWAREFSHTGIDVGERLAETLKIRRPPSMAEALALWIAIEREKDLLEDLPGGAYDKTKDDFVDHGPRDTDWNATRKGLFHRATIGKIETLFEDRGAILAVTNKDNTSHPFLWWNTTEV
jgi:transcriptional regulator with XRE-family HTH domain